MNETKDLLDSEEFNQLVRHCRQAGDGPEFNRFLAGLKAWVADRFQPRSVVDQSRMDPITDPARLLPSPETSQADKG